MKPRLSPKRNAAMTLFEVGVLVTIILVLVALLLPRLQRPRHDRSRIICVNNLKQLGLAYRIWEGDNGDIYPMGISITNGGSMEMVNTGDVLQTFLVMSNELSTPKILFCPADVSRHPATSFSGLSNANISYFVCVDVTNNATNPMMIISGDCNFEMGGVPVKPGLNAFGSHDPLAWSATRHMNAGNIGLADGSVQQVTDAGLTNALIMTGLATNRFVMP